MKYVICCWMWMLAAGLTSPALGQDESGLRISGVRMEAGSGVGLEFSYSDELVGSTWSVYSCDVTADGEGGAWVLAEEALLLTDALSAVWTDWGQGDRAGIAACPVRLYLLRQVLDGEPETVPETLVFRATHGIVAGSGEQVVRVDALTPEEVSRLFAVGFDSEEGFALGSLDDQNSWTCVGEVVVQAVEVDGGDQAVALRGPEARMTRKIVSDGSSRATIEISIYVDSKSGVQSTGITLPKRTSASIAFHPKRGFFAYDGNGSGGGTWKLVPDSLFLDQWVQVVIHNDYVAKSWAITIEDKARLADLGFRNDELEHIEEINLYAGNNREMLIDSIVVEEGTRGE